MVRIRRLELVAPADDGQCRREWIRRSRHRGQRIGQRDRRRRVELNQRRERRRQHAALEEIALAGERVVEDAERRANAGAAVTGRVPRHRQARRDVVLVSGDDATRDVRVARIDQTGGRRRELLRSNTGVEAANGVVLVDERRRQFIAHAEAQRQLRREAELVLRVSGKQETIAFLNGLLRGGARLCRQAKQEIGRGVAGEAAAEREVAVRPVDEGDAHGLAPDIGAELQRVASGNPREIVGDLPHMVHAIDEWLLCVAKRGVAAAKESRDRQTRAARPPTGWCWRN